MASSPLSTTDDLRVLVVADDHLSRAGLAALLADEPGCEIVGQVSSAEYHSPDVDIYEPDVVVWDLGWDAAGGVGQLADHPESGPPIVALVSDESAAAAVWASGARGLLFREADGTAVFKALDAVAHGMAVMDPALTPSSLGRGREDGLSASPAELTPRELQVLALIAEGLPNKAVALRLDISEHTVKFHVNSILGKLGAQSRTEAVTRATRMGLISL